ncbi:Fmu (Sun) domain-containing protein [Paraflavisolibacter sp. H34]|uniref:Fmu (Sun) domain-containing protein n=1 Tax=Huijunlia imazamoxiresistens TaxID=3127457 RepID=UPI0030194900
MFIQAYLQTAQTILQAYAGEEPFPSFLKKFFSLHKKFGSRDRRQITHLCYCYFRLGHALRKMPVAERLLLALFLCSREEQPVLKALRPEWNEAVTAPLAEKIHLAAPHDFRAEAIFPWKAEVSEQLAFDAFSHSFLVQPDTFLRLRPGKEQVVKKKLEQAGIPFRPVNDHCLAVAPATKIDEVLQLNAEAVVQDASSQQVLDGLWTLPEKERKIRSAWDCCAASGGKSILLKDRLPGLRLTVSDVRESILINLKKRFAEAGIRDFQAFVADVAAPGFSQPRHFDLVLCDVPCTGSGTWGRTPEQLYFFEKEKIGQYAALQRRIVQHAVRSLPAGGILVYCTCSVFRQENEEAVAFFQNELSLQLLHQQYWTGYRQRADTLFSAVLLKS